MAASRTIPRWAEKSVTFYVLLCIFSASCEDTHPRLLSVFLLARHGERYPCHHLLHPDYPKAYLNKTCQLTKNGAKQHFKLGQLIHKRYSALFSSQSFYQDSVHLRSTGTERTIRSAFYFGLGLNSHISDEVAIVPAVFSTPKRHDGVLKVSSPCAAFRKLARDSLNSDLAINFANRESLLFEELNNFTDFKFDLLAPHRYLPEVWELCDPIFVWNHLHCESNDNFTLPFSQRLADACHRALSFKQQVHFANVSQTALRGGPLVRHALRVAHRAAVSDRQSSTHDSLRQTFIGSDVNGTDDLDIPIPPTSRLIAYFAHDSTIVAFLSHLGMYDNVVPPFASAVILEVYGQGKELYVDFLYLNNTRLGAPDTAPTHLSSPLCGSVGRCSLRDLEANLPEPIDIEKACLLDTEGSPSTWSSFRMALAVLGASFACSFALPLSFTVRVFLCLLSVGCTHILLNSFNVRRAQ